MSRPTKEQIAQSREYVSGLLESYAIRSMMSGAEIGAVHDLLAATAEPTEQELDAEADTLAGVGLTSKATVRRIYTAGARREGAR
jgi:hypothetical protein